MADKQTEIVYYRNLIAIHGCTSAQRVYEDWLKKNRKPIEAYELAMAAYSDEQVYQELKR